MSFDKSEDIESCLDSIQAGIKMVNTFMKPVDDNPEKEPILIASKVLLDSLDGCLARMSDYYEKYHQEVVVSVTKMVNSLNQEFKIVMNNINDVHEELDEYKKDGDAICNAMDEFKKNNYKELQLHFSNSNHVYEFDVELMKKYPGSYFWELYNDHNRWMNNGDIYVDHSCENYESIIKYMKNDMEDDSLLKDLKNMDVKKRNEFVNDLDFLKLPVKINYMNELCFDDDKMKMEAWKKRVIMVNGKNAVNLNMYLKKNGSFDMVFNKNNIENIKYFKKNNIMYVNMNLKYADFIEDYCKNGQINEELIEKGNGNSLDNFDNELKQIGIELKEDEKKNAIKHFKSVLFKNSTILESSQYDTKLQEWFDYQYQWKLIYKASEHNYTSKSFHEYCDSKGPTLIIIKSSEGWIFGGFTTKSWSSNWENKIDSNAFIFTLKNPHNISPTKYNKLENNVSSIHCRFNYGPIFGKFNDNNYYDILIDDNCNKSNSCSFDNDGENSYECNSEYRKSLFVNTNKPEERNYFSVSDYEVYTIDNYDDYLKNKYKYIELIIDYLKNNKINIDLIHEDCSEVDLLSELNECEITLNSESQDILFNHYYTPSNVLLNSHIVDSEYDQYINEWIGNDYKWKLIYRASEHNYTAKSFHKYCDIKGPTLIVIKSSCGWIFGGYTSVSWKYKHDTPAGYYCEFKDDSNAFIFTLKNPHQVPPTKYNKRKESEYAIRCDPKYGPIFDGYNGVSDIFIKDNCNQSNNYIYNDDLNGYECNSEYRKSLFVNTNEPDEANFFLVLDYEVYTINN